IGQMTVQEATRTEDVGAARTRVATSAIAVDGLVKRYRNAVDGISFRVEHGEFFALLGPNGAGKTTTLSILTTTLAPTAGRALILDEPTTGLDAPRRRAVWSYLRDVRAANATTIVLTSHYLEEAEQADRICVIDAGRIVATGAPADLTAALASEYLLVDADD